MRDARSIEQVKDDPELLKLMMKDHLSVSDLFKPTNYWSYYEKTILSELQELGLHDFRGRNNSLLSSFGATDLHPFSALLNLWIRLSSSPYDLRIIILRFFVKMYLKIMKLQTHLTRNSIKCPSDEYRSINLSCYKFAKSYGEKNGAKPINEFEGSLVGNPENVFYVNGKLYTNSLLSHYTHYAYCCKHMNFDSIDTIMEIGSGSGKQIEVIKKLHKHLCFYVFDISPQLYVCEQYLSALFPDSVVSYRQTRTMKSIPEPQKGKIFIFGNWKIPELTNLNSDLFWNAESFQEMEPAVVLNYLKYVNQKTTKYVFLNERMKGVKVALTKKKFGVLEQTKLEHYKRGLKDFRLEDLSRTIFLPRISSLFSSYEYSFWKRK